MRAVTAPLLLLLASLLALAGCRGAGTGAGTGAGDGKGAAGADATFSELNSFTDEVLRAVEAAPDPKAGVAEAQKLLDARAGEMAARLAALKRGARAQDAASRGKWLEAEVDNTDRVHRLQVRYSDASARDPELKARLDKLVADYDSIFRDR